MRASRFWGLALIISALGAVWAQSASADEAATIYDPGTVDVIDLTLPKASEEVLEEHPTDDYVEGFLTLSKTSGAPGTEKAPVINAMKVGIRLKGSVGGSFRDLSGKAAFKIKCNFVKGAKCLGLKKMTLNNMVQDPSMIHETLAYAAFRGTGVPASRTGYAYVSVNGQDFGLYLNLETLDDVSLKRIFGAFDDKAQHLYEGELGDDVVPGGAADFEVDEGSEERGDLEALIEAANGSGSEPWSTRIAPHAELAEMTRMWAVEKYIDHWDGYSGHAEPGQERPNNYYLYSEPSGRFQMLPWGTDQTWIPTIGVGTPGREVTFDGHGGVLFNKCLEDPQCGRSYWEALQGVTKAIAALDPGALAADTVDLLAPWQEEEREHGRPESDAGDVKDGVEETLDYISGRPAEANEWLAAHVPPENPIQPPIPPLAPKPAPATMRIDSFTVADGVLTTRMYVTGSGTVSQQAKLRIAKRSVGVCSTHEEMGEAGSLTLHCRLSPAARRRLRARWLRIDVSTYFVPTGGVPEAVTHGKVARRDPSLQTHPG